MNSEYVDANLRISSSIALFDDKDRDCTKPSLRAESTYSFYDRSSLAGYTHLRQMLQRWVDRLPSGKQRDIVGRMRHRGHGSLRKEQSFNGAFFELFLHEFLNGTGGYTVVVEPKIGHLTPDFGVTETGPDQTQFNYVVEATDINVVSNTELDSNWKEQRALDILDGIQSPDYYLKVTTEGDLDVVPRSRELKRPFEDLVRNADYENVRATMELYGLSDQVMPSAMFRHRDWSITGHLVPVSAERRGRKGRFIGVGPARSDIYDAIGKVKARFYDKAKQYRDVDNLIIALRGDCWLEREDVAETLFGRMALTWYELQDLTDACPLPPRTVQKPDGFWFNTNGPQNENVIGVVIFHSLNLHSVDQATAIFYGNPYTDKPLPAWAKALTHAEYSNSKVGIVEGISPCAFVKDHEPWRGDWELERRQGAN